MHRGALLCYRLATHLLLPLAAPFLLLADRRKGKQRPPLPLRLGYRLPPVPQDGVLVHAVSVGEVMVARRLLNELRQCRPELPLILSATTATGLQVATAAPAADATLPFPLDLPGPARRFLAATSPRLVVLVETELWPELLAACEQRKIPVAVVNARVSDRSFPRYRLMAPLLRPLLAPIQVALAQTPQDADRLVAMGLPPERVRVVGNIKFDAPPPPSVEPQLAAVLSALAGSRGMLVAGSTMPGEEELVLAAWKELAPRPLLLLAPRHPERAGEVLNLCLRLGIPAQRRTPLPDLKEATDVVVLDTVGELASLYRLAQVAFVGGSLVPTGGHNPIEPALFSLPIVSGPHVTNFRFVYQELERAGGVQWVRDSRELAVTLARLFHHPEQAREQGTRAARVLAQHAGATKHAVQALLSLIP
ncbi:MAG: 3-deoxy-D-manno-octulosonic acid transferase [Thermoanaerobaculum sp.]|nr:3-deoxy-D-manno-octulosonic acid transferase [Thermoanaerobaculum sp.]